MRAKSNRKPKIHAIDLDNSYSISGRMKSITGQISDGAYPGARGAVVLLRYEKDGCLITRRWLCGQISDDGVTTMLHEALADISNNV